MDGLVPRHYNVPQGTSKEIVMVSSVHHESDLPVAIASSECLRLPSVAFPRPDARPRARRVDSEAHNSAKGSLSTSSPLTHRIRSHSNHLRSSPRYPLGWRSSRAEEYGQHGEEVKCDEHRQWSHCV